MVNNNTPVSYECKTNPEPKLLADVNVADMMRATLDVLMITRGMLILLIRRYLVILGPILKCRILMAVV